MSGYIIFVPIIFSFFLPIIWLPCLLRLEFQFPLTFLNCIMYKWHTYIIIKFCPESISIFLCQWRLHLSCIFLWHNIFFLFPSQFWHIKGLPFSWGDLAPCKYLIKWGSPNIVTLRVSSYKNIIWKRCWYTYIVPGLGAAWHDCKREVTVCTHSKGIPLPIVVIDT